jgi:hypothetical protein
MTALFTHKPIKSKPSKLAEVTLRGWPGGWNAIHNDIAMDAKYLVEALNLTRQPNGDMSVRWGSALFADVESVTTSDAAIDCDYFNGRLVIVMDNGEVCSVTDSGVPALIWDEAIANALPGAPSGWGSEYTTVDFVPFRNQLIIHNGVDKPITVADDFAVTYLQDLASGSNVNTPIGKYGCVVSNYHCVAGVSASSTTVYISSSGTAGTFPGDDPPNDSISIDVGAYAPEGATEIRGIAGFRSYLIVFFQTQALPVLLGEYDATTGAHTPQFPDVLPKFGLLGHRTICQLANDIQFADMYGLANASRNLFSGLFDTKHLSAFIEPPYRAALGALTETQRMEECFMLYDPTVHTVQLYVPGGRSFVYAFSDEPDLKYKAWSQHEHEAWTCGCTSALGRTFLVKGTKIYQRGNPVFPNEQYYADRVGDFDATWNNATLYTVGQRVRDGDDDSVWVCEVEHTSAALPITFANDRAFREGYWTEYEGDGIEFDMELPWIGGEERLKAKQLRFTALETSGTAEFTMELYVDKLYKDASGTVIYDPVISIPFIAEDAPGFGEDSGPYGAGRVSFGHGLYKTPTKFRRLKMRLFGTVRKPLSISTATFLFVRGRYKR